MTSPELPKNAETEITHSLELRDKVLDVFPVEIEEIETPTTRTIMLCGDEETKIAISYYPYTDQFFVEIEEVLGRSMTKSGDILKYISYRGIEVSANANLEGYGVTSFVLNDKGEQIETEVPVDDKARCKIIEHEQKQLDEMEEANGLAPVFTQERLDEFFGFLGRIELV